MRHRDIVRLLKDKGWWLKRSGKHDIWTNGERTMPIPRGGNMTNNTLKALLQCIDGKGPFAAKANVCKGDRDESKDV